MYVPRDVTLNRSSGQLMEYPLTAADNGFVVNAFSGTTGLTGGGMNSIQQSVTNNNVMIPLLEGIMPNDPHTRYRLYRDMYDHDPISGGAVDVLSSFLGDFHLSGVDDQNRMDKFAATASSISPATLFPLMTREYLVHGQFIGTKIFDKKKGYITGISPHASTSVSATPIPVHGYTPMFELGVEDSFKKLINSNDPRIKDIVSSLPDVYRKALQHGSIPLSPENTIFFPRQQLAGDVMGTSLFERTLAVYLIEKNLFRGTIDASNRRQRSILHALVSGDQDWEPDRKYLDAITQAIKQADMDPQGAVLTTRDNINMTQFMEPQNFWSVDQINGWASEMKYFAYRISPDLINGTASLSTLDASLSIMVNDMRQYRSMFEHKIIQQSIFGDVAIANGFQKKAGHRTGSLAVDKKYGKQTYNLADYELPNIVWKQSLSPEGDSNYLQMLHEISDMGVPVNLSMFAAAAGLNIEDLLAGAAKDIDIRKEARKYWKQIDQNSSAMVQQEVQNEFAMKQQAQQAAQQAKEQEAQQAQQAQMQAQQQGQDPNQDPNQQAQQATAALAGLASLNHGIRRKGWDQREWNPDQQGFNNSDSDGKYRTGTTEGRKMRRDKLLRQVAELLAKKSAREVHDARESEWQRKHR